MAYTPEFRIAIVDDEPLFTNLLMKMSNKLLSDTSSPYVIDTFNSGEELLSSLSATNNYQLFFLDILLDGMNGMDLARRIREIVPDAKLVFITSSVEYAVESYEVAPLHYLVKPVTVAALEEVFKRFFHFFGDNTLKKDETVILKSTSNQKIIFSYSDILYAEIINSRITVHTKTSSFVCRGRMDDLQNLLPMSQFYRCHRSFLINLQHVTGIRRYDFILGNGSFVPVAKGCYKDASLALNEYLEK